MKSVVPIRHTFCAATLGVAISISGPVLAGEKDGAEATVAAFHAALRRGDAPGAMKLLASDAFILESGSAETRDEYERHHLPEDIAFARSVNTTRSIVGTQVEGNVACVIATNRIKGSFAGREVNSNGTELTILTKTSEGWRIRAVHWSSRQLKEKD